MFHNHTSPYTPPKRPRAPESIANDSPGVNCVVHTSKQGSGFAVPSSQTSSSSSGSCKVHTRRRTWSHRRHVTHDSRSDTVVELVLPAARLPNHPSHAKRAWNTIVRWSPLAVRSSLFLVRVGSLRTYRLGGRFSRLQRRSSTSSQHRRGRDAAQERRHGTHVLHRHVVGFSVSSGPNPESLSPFCLQRDDRSFLAGSTAKFERKSCPTFLGSKAGIGTTCHRHLQVGTIHGAPTPSMAAFVRASVRQRRESSRVRGPDVRIAFVRCDAKPHPSNCTCRALIHLLIKCPSSVEIETAQVGGTCGHVLLPCPTPSSSILITARK